MIKKKKEMPGLKSSIKVAVEQAEIQAIEKIQEEDKKIENIKELVSKSLVELIPVNKIIEIEYADGNLMHNRTGLTQNAMEKIKDFANAILKMKPQGLFNSGLLQQITVRKKANTDLYERIVGFRRLEAFKLNNEEFIPATIIECDDKTARLIRNAENENREGLSTYDKLLGYLEAIQLYAGFNSVEELKNFLYRCKHHLNKKNTFEFNEDELIKMAYVEKIVSEKVGIGIVRLVDKLEILNFNTDVKEALHNNLITETNAIIVNRIKDSLFRSQILDWTIKNNPTKIALKDYISNNIIDVDFDKEDNKSSIFIIKEFVGKIKNSDFKNLSKEDKNRVDEKLFEIQNNLKSLFNILNK